MSSASLGDSGSGDYSQGRISSSQENRSSLVDALARVRCRSKGPFPSEVSKTVLWTLQLLLGEKENVLLFAAQKALTDWVRMDRDKRKVATTEQSPEPSGSHGKQKKSRSKRRHTDEAVESASAEGNSDDVLLGKSLTERRALSHKFTSDMFGFERETRLIDQMLLIAKPGKKKLQECLADFLCFVLMSWGIDEEAGRSFAAAVYSRSNGGKDPFHTRLGKKHLPVWKKRVLVHCLTTYVLFKDIFLQFIENFFSGKGEQWLTKIPNPDYYGRLGGSAFDVMMLFAVFNARSRKKFCHFVLSYEFGEEVTKIQDHLRRNEDSGRDKPKKLTCKTKEYLARLKMLRSNGNTQRYLPDVSYATDSSERPSSQYGSPRFLRLSEDSSRESSDDISATPPLTPQASLSQLAVRHSYKDGTSMSAPFYLTIAEPAQELCIPLHYEFYREYKVNVVCAGLSDALTRLGRSGIPPADAIIIWGNAFGFPGNDRIWDLEEELRPIFGSRDVFIEIRKVIFERYLGEMPLFSAISLSGLAPSDPVVIFVCTQRTTEHCSNVAAAVWSAFLACCAEKNPKISHVAMTGLWSADRFEIDAPLEYIASRETYLSWKRLRSKPPTDMGEVMTLAQQERARVSRPRSETHMTGLIIQLAKFGELFLRKILSSEEVDVLLAVVCNPNKLHDKEARAACADVIASYCFRNPPGLRSFASQELLQSVMAAGAIPPLLQMVEAGELEVHHEISLADLSRDSLLAEGGQGKVFRGRLRAESAALHPDDDVDEDSIEDSTQNVYLEVAIKVMNEMTNLNFSEIEFKREIATMSMLRHEHLVTCFGAVTTARESEGYMIVTEFIGPGENGIGGSLESMLHDSPDIEIPFERVLAISIQIASGLSFLHDNGLMHRDIKSSNVLVRSDWTALLCDFGTTRVGDPDFEREKTAMTGTLCYMAPEIFNRQDYSFSADVYSFAILMCEIATRERPFDDMRGWDIPVAVSKGERPILPPTLSQTFIKLVGRCWAKRAAGRPTMPEVFSELRIIGGKRHVYG